VVTEYTARFAPVKWLGEAGSGSLHRYGCTERAGRLPSLKRMGGLRNVLGVAEYSGCGAGTASTDAATRRLAVRNGEGDNPNIFVASLPVSVPYSIDVRRRRLL